MRRHLNITGKLAFILVVFGAALLGSLGALAYASGQSGLREAAASELLTRAIEKQAALDSWIAVAQTDIVIKAENPDLVEQATILLYAVADSPEAINAHDQLVADVRPYVDSDTGFTELFFIEAESGQVLASTDPGQEGKFKETRPYFINGRDAPYVSEMYYSIALGSPAMTAAAPVVSADGRLLGVLAGRLDLEVLNTLISRRSVLRQTDDTFLVNNIGLLVTQPRFAATPSILKQTFQTEAIQRCLAGNNGLISADDHRGVPVLVSYRWLPIKKMCLIAKIDQAEAFAPVAAFTRTIALAGGLTLVSAIALAVILARVFTRPILALQTGVKRLAQGDLEYRVAVKSSDEIGLLAADFNEMADLLQEREHERKQAEETLIASEVRYRRLFEAARDGILILDAETGMIVDVNPFLVEILGFSREQFLGKKVWELGFFKDIIANQINLLELQQKEYIRYEDMPLETANGERLEVEFVSNVYLMDGKKVIQCNIRDITERKQTEEIIRKSEERYRTTLDSMLEGCQIIGFDWRYLYINAEAEKQNNRPSAELMGQNYIEMWPGIESTNIFRVLQRCMEERGTEYLENEFTFPDGTTGWFELNIQPIPEGILILSSDITARKRADEERLAREIAERASQAKNEFLSRMSHELRTPLNSILGFAQVLQMDKLTSDQMGSLDQVLKSGHHLLDLINEVLDISRIESGHLPISPEPVQLHETLKSAAELIRPLADRRGIRIHIAIPSSQDIFITADRQRLRQVLLNLLSNAVKYNRENGEIEISASLLVDGFMHLTVRDTGNGIPPEKMGRLFMPFDRLELDPVVIEGTGLGLALTKGLVEAMGGRIGAQSVVGEGSSFWFDLQLTSQQKDAIVMAEVDNYMKNSPNSRKGLVLYVEDNLSNIRLIEKILARLTGVELLSAMQGRLALDMAPLHKPDLILLDMHLPDIPGSEVLKQLQAGPETRDIPIVIMSADAAQGQIDRMLAAGAHTYLTKPIDVREFLEVVGKILKDANST